MCAFVCISLKCPHRDVCLISQSTSLILDLTHRDRKISLITQLKQEGILETIVSLIDEMTRCTAPQGLAEQSYIPFVWITLQIWQPEQEMCFAHQAHNERSTPK